MSSASSELRCLFLSPFVPFPPHDGGRLRVHRFVTSLAKRHRVELLAFGDAARDAEGIRRLRDAGVTVTTVPLRGGPTRVGPRALIGNTSFYGTLHTSRAFASLVRQRVDSASHDLVQAEYAFMGAYRHAVRGGPPWLLDEHNVEFRLNETLLNTERSWLYQLYGRREARLRRREELAACRAADRVLTVSETDDSILHEAVPGVATTLIPNGVDTAALPDVDAATGTAPRLIFVGKMDYRPNIDAVRWFCAEILPALRSRHPSLAFDIVGADPVPSVRRLHGEPGVTVTGRVTDTRPYLNQASIVVVPLRAGSGTRLKVLEAFSAGKAVVSTTLGAEGLAVQDGEQILLADDPGAFCRCIDRMLASPDLRYRMGIAGRRLVEQRYSWDHIVRQLEKVHADVVTKRS